MKKEQILEVFNEQFPGVMCKINFERGEAFIEFWTVTAGQDVIVDFVFDGTAEDFIEEFRKYAENYDPDYEAQLYIENGMLGKRGVPSDIRTLLDDMDEAKETLEEISEALMEIE